VRTSEFIAREKDIDPPAFLVIAETRREPETLADLSSSEHPFSIHTKRNAYWSPLLHGLLYLTTHYAQLALLRHLAYPPGDEMPSFDAFLLHQ